MVFFFLGFLIQHLTAAWPGPSETACLFSLLFLGLLLKESPEDLLFLGLGYGLALTLARPLTRCDPWLWFVCEGDHTKDAFYRFLSETRLAPWAQALRARMEERLMAWDPRWGAWMLGMLTGQKQEPELEELYRSLGLLHVLVISGSHFSLLGLILQKVLFSPFYAAYAWRLLSPRFWVNLRFLLDALLLGLALFFLLMVGAAPPCQRAFFCLFVLRVQAWISGPSQALMTALVLQAFVFPSSFFSLSNLLSWGASACLLFSSRSLQTECLIQSMSLAIFSSFSPLGILLNIVLAKVWDLLLCLGLILLFCPWDGVLDWLRKGAEAFHLGLGFLAAWQEGLWQASRLTFHPAFAPLLRWLALIPFSLVLIRTLSPARESQACGFMGRAVS